MKPASAAIRLFALAAVFLPAVPLRAGQREVLTGTVTFPATPQAYDFFFSYRPGSDPAVALVSGLGSATVLKTFPRQRFEVVRDVFVTVGGIDTRNWPRYTDRGTALRPLPDELLAPAGVPLSPERWAGASTGLQPTLHESQPFEVTAPADYDGDGVSDDLDAFPADPAESADHDHDGTGDNADPDDDNDLMSDTYEMANNLDPFTDDSGEDPDGDGFTNLEEYAAGTAARDGNSYFHIESVAHPSPGKVILTWQAFPGRRYEVWHRPQLDPRGSLLAGDLRVAAPGPLSATVEAGDGGDFLFVLVIADPL
jgi:hypothetical protein